MRNKKATARPGFLPEDEQVLLMNNIDLLGDDYISISVSSVMRPEGCGRYLHLDASIVTICKLPPPRRMILRRIDLARQRYWLVDLSQAEADAQLDTHRGQRKCKERCEQCATPETLVHSSLMPTKPISVGGTHGGTH